MLIFANESTNLYEISRDHNEKSFHDNITQTYKREVLVEKKIVEAKQFAKHLGDDDRIKCYSEQHAFITLQRQL